MGMYDPKNPLDMPLYVGTDQQVAAFEAELKRRLRQAESGEIPFTRNDVILEAFCAVSKISSPGNPHPVKGTKLVEVFA